MCNGSSTRTTQGGTIATLRPTTTTTPSTSAHYDLLFSNTSTRTRATFRTSQPANLSSLSDCWIVIHHDGDLTRSHTRPAKDPLHRLPIAGLDASVPDDASSHSDTSSSSSSSMSSGPASAFIDLPQALELGFGGKGVIGRRVALVEGYGARGWMGRTVAEGVIGWN